MERTKYTPKRLLSLLLALIMLLGMLPTAVFAADPVKQYSATSFINDGGARMDVELSCNNPLEVSTLPYEVTVDVHLTITVTGNDVKMVTLDTQDAGNLIKIGGKNATKESLGGSYWNGLDEMVPAQAADGTTPAAFAVNTKIIDATISGATGTLNKDRTISVPIKTTLGVTNTASINVNKAIDQNVIFENVKLNKYIVSFAGDFKGQPVNNEMLLTSGDVNLPDLGVTYTEKDYTFKGWLNEVTHAVQTGTVTVSQDTTFRAQWEAAQPKQYTVTFWTQKEGGKVFSTETVVEGKGTPRPAGTPEAPEAGKVFDKWCYTIEDGTDTKEEEFNFGTFINGDMTVYATWTDAPTKYTVKWDGVYTGVSNLPATTFVVKTDNTQVNAPSETPMRDGYAFAGWAAAKNSTTAVTFPYAISGDTTFYALWTRNQVKITWPTSTPAGVELTHPAPDDADGFVTSVDVGSEVTFQIMLGDRYEIGTVKAGDRVLGSTVNGNIYTYTFTADKNLTVAVGNPTVKKFTISLPQGDGYEATFVECKAYDATGLGSADLEEANDSTSYTFEYGDSFKIKLEAYADTTATLRVDGTKVFEVDGNSAETKNTTGAYTVNKMYNITVGTKRKITRMVTFSLEPYGGLYTIMPVENGNKIYAPAKPEIPGYEFGGWYKDAKHTEGNEWHFLPVNDGTLNEDQMKNLEAQADVVKGNIVIYGKLTALTYDVTYNANLPAGVTVSVPVPNKQTKTHGKVLPLSKDEPTLTGYTFKGWATSKDGPVAYMPGSDYVADAPVELFAVWAKNTYTVTISAGTGYSTVPSGTATVEWGETFTLAIKVDASHSSKTPTIKYTSTEGGVTSAEVEVVGDSTATELQWTSGHPTPAKPTTWYYKIENVHKDYSISISIDPNDIYPVSFYAVLGDGNAQNGTKESAPFLIQSVEHGYYASMPAAPEREGYKFDHWERDNVANTEVFSTQITAATEIRAVYKAIVPKITVVKVKDANNGWELKNWQAIGKKLISFTPSDNKPYPISYGDDVTFDLVIQPGYDYSKLSVSANGYELGRESIKTDDKGVTTISFRLVYVTANTRITVSGIERKTITVTYNENALDHVSNLPAPQTANYYISGDRNNTDFTKQVPVRNGYTFLGWALSGTVTTPDYKIEDIKDPGVEIPFTADTTVYAIWEAKALTTELWISDEYVNEGDGTSTHSTLDYAYEGERIYLTGKLSAPAQGTMTFYKRLTKPNTIWVEAEDWTLIGTATVNGSQYGTIETTAESYRWDNLSEVHAKNYRWDYKVVFTPANEEGYQECNGHDDLRVYSKAISWGLDKNTDVTKWTLLTNANKLTVYKDSIAESNKVTDGVMVANNTYWLQIPKVIELDGGLNTELKVGEHYEIIWEYQDSENHWTTYTTTTDTDWVKVTPEFSGYTFRAKVKPSANSIYTKAATYTDANALVPDVYWDYLITAPTNATVLKETKTTLTIDTDDELNSIVIKNEKPFETLGVGSHKAQFEGQTITLTAKVTKTDETTAVNMGTVEFYRQVTDEDGTTNWVSIGTAKLEDEGTVTGEASIEFRMPKYVTGKTPLQNKEVFKAVYVQNVTYKTSESAKSEAYIKSAQLQIPVIMDADKPTAHKGYWLNGETKVDGGDANKTETTYNYHLGGLMAGIPHTFELKKTAYADGATADYSVVARDGRAVPADMYTMKWETLTDANWKTTTTTGDTYTAETTKVGDRYHILLTGAKNSPFDGSEVVSKDIAIGDPQGVTVTVEAIDAIKATEVDRDSGKYPDVYQLNEITLTATVEAAEAGADRKPTGTVAFYYVDENNAFQPLGEAELKPDTSGKMVAQITTDELPVDPDDNTRRDVKITAVYFGDETFKPSENWGPKNGSTTEWEVKATDITDKVKSDTVTVYSSVIFNCADENKKQASTDKGIHINVEDGVLKVNEKATLKLSDIYTLDRELDDDLLNIIAKLDPDTDYTVRWQKLNGATAIGDEEGTDFANSKRWTDIGATGTTLVLDQVEQDTAYRAVITVNDQPITKGSYTKVEQTVKGRQVYYSNVLMATDTNMTVSVALNTSKIDAENTEGITEGEIVTANVYLSGVVGAVPNANVTVTVTNDSSKGNGTAGDYKQVLGNKNTVNGWNAFDWDTTGVTPGFYTLTVSAKTNTGYAQNEITRSLIVRESTYGFELQNSKDAETYETTYNGRTQGLTVTLKDFHFSGDAIDNAASKSWTVKYYDQQGKLVEPSQAGTYKAVVTLPASAYWTKQTQDFTFTIQPRKVSVEDAVAQAKVYDNSTTVNIVEVMLNDAETDQATTGWLKSGENTGIINGDSIYAVATKAALRDKNAGENKFDISEIELRGDDAANYVWNGTAYTEDIYVSRSQVYGEHGTLELKQGETFPADKVIKMIDQSGREITLGTGTEDYTLTFYYHSDTKIEKTTDISKLGLYTVVARPNQSNYKSGVTMQFNVVETATVPTPATTPKASTLITISNTAELYGKSTGVTASTTNDAATTTIEYQSGSTGWTTTAPTSAGRYLVRVTANTGDVAYGIYTITKAHPELTITPADTTYNSMPQNGYSALTGNNGTEGVDWHITYAGDVAISFDVPEEGNVAEQAPVDAGDYVATLHVNETTNYTAHEVSTTFTIKKAPLTITADSWQTTQYDAFPDMTAKYEGLAAVDTDTTPDTSLRDVQIAPEYLYNPTNGKSNYNNDTLDQVGYVAIQPVDALSKNYAITYENGQYTKQRTDPNIDFAIHGLPQSGDRTVNRVYFGDVIQLYPYGYYTKLGNGSAILEWSVTKGSEFKGDVTIDKDKGILNVAGVGDFTVTLKRGVGEQQISTSVTVAAIQKEAKVALKNVDKVYTGASQTYAYEGNVTVHDELYQPIGNFVDSKLTRTNTARIDVGTQITTAKVTGAWAYQSETYGGKYTINDKEATVEPKEDTHIYGQTRQIKGYDDLSNALINGLTASQTDDYNRLDVHDGYEILVAGTENMNYNVKYKTDHNDSAKDAEDSKVTEYTNVVFKSMTHVELNDATVYGETPNVLDWTLENTIESIRGSKSYADNLADFDLESIFVEQDYDNCVGNADCGKFDYKAANRTTTTPATPEYNQAALAAKRTSVDEEMDENYTLKFKTVLNSGAANYRLTNNETGNATTTTTALTNGSKGFIPATGETGIETGENFVEGSANIAQRPVTVKKASTIGTVSLYWRLPQSKLYTALLNILEAEENSTNRGLAKGHTIRDLDLAISIQGKPIDPNSNNALEGLTKGDAQVVVKVGDTNYVLDGDGKIGGVELKTIQIEATYTTKTATNFVVLIKIRNQDKSTTPLESAAGLSYEILRKVNGSFDGKTYASGKLTYTGRMATDKFGDECGVFTASYGPLSNIGGTYFIQMYEYGVALKTKNS